MIHKPRAVNKAKGLDSLAVNMLDIERFDKLSKPQEQMNYFMGASPGPAIARDSS